VRCQLVDKICQETCHRCIILYTLHISSGYRQLNLLHPPMEFILNRQIVLGFSLSSIIWSEPEPEQDKRREKKLQGTNEEKKTRRGQTKRETKFDKRRECSPQDKRKEQTFSRPSTENINHRTGQTQQDKTQCQHLLD
jgi:hypothetical protein